MDQPRKPGALLRRISHGVALCALSQWGGRAALGATQLPVPCVGVSCSVNAGKLGSSVNGFVSSGAATAVQSGKTLTVSQTSANATLNWSSFNISADGKVAFNQPSSTSIALNRIFDSNPSSIFGTLTANGQVYLLNANGFLFGSTATVNVAGLIASSLNITDSTFAAGILAPGQQAAPALQQFAIPGATPGTSTPILNIGSITVQAGAQLTAADGGRLLLAAPTVTNSGSLSSPDGQIVLAAGQNVYLQASGDTSLRGLIVEVDGGTGAAQQLTAPTVSNQSPGQLSAARGNVTLVGLAVNQDGRISATTSTSANGSVVLEAADGFVPSGSSAPIQANTGGTLTIGPDSLIDILPEYSDTTTAVAAQVQLQSSISLTAQQVLMHGGTIEAPGGTLSVLAAANPSNNVLDDGNSLAKIRIDSGTTIDLAGSDAVLPMSANLVTLQLRSNEFADDPTQRNGALRGQTVTIDARADGGAGTPIADVAAAIAAVGQNIAQRTEKGGTATFLSEGDIVFNPGASINVSGGATTYQGGTIQTTALVGANGQLYDIGSANPLLTYTGVVNPTFSQSYNKWGVTEVVPTPGLSHYESTYQQGAAAGAVQFAAPSLALGGSLQGSAVNGPYQRGTSAQTGAAVPGGTLVIGDPAGAGNAASISAQTIDYLAPAIELTNTPTPLVVNDSVALPVQTLQLPAGYLSADGFTNTKLYSNSNVTLPAGVPLQLLPGASLSVVAPRIVIDSNISALGGMLSFDSVSTFASLLANQPQAGVGVGDGVTLDASGQWTNDTPKAGGLGTAPTLQNGGSISLQLTAPGSELVLGNNVALKANGGAWVTSSGSVTYGSGGTITLDASPAPDAVQIGQGSLVEAFATGTATGGTFSLSAPRIEVSQSACADSPSTCAAGSSTAWTEAQRVDDSLSPGKVLAVYASLFSNYGFSSVNLTATGAVESPLTNDVLTLASGTTITALSRTLQLAPGYQTVSTGGTVAGLTQAALLPQYARPVTNVSLNALRENDDYQLGNSNFGDLDIQPGASILTDPGASIALNATGSILIGGTLRAPGGAITASILTPLTSTIENVNFDPGFQPAQGITLASTALLDVSGTSVLTPNSMGLQQGTVYSGGAVNLIANRGTVIAQSGSSIDIAGASATLDIANPGTGGGYQRATIGSAGGSLTVSSTESISLLGSLNATAGSGGGAAAAAGSLVVDLTRTSGIEPGLPQYPGSELSIELLDSTAGTTPNAPGSNIAVLGAQQIEQSGIDSLTLRAGGAAVVGNIFLNAAQLTLGRQITFDAPNLTLVGGINANISAPDVQLGNSAVQGASAAPSSLISGYGTLAVSAQQINLFGNFALQSMASTTLSSAGDVQLQGAALNPTGPEIGSVLTNGNLNINAERVYPDTFTNFAIQSKGAGATVSIGSTGASPGTPLSAGGSLDVGADNIMVSGTVVAPFGRIALTANESLTLASGSKVSVSGAGIDVLYGQTQENGAQWLYDTSGGKTAITGLPTKQVSLSAPNITMSSGATVDVRGGGNLSAYEWIPGTGGSYDALYGNGSAAGTNSSSNSIAGTLAKLFPGLYAILPADRGQAAPYDPEESTSTNQAQTVYLSGGAGIAAGYYALLPARYALEPGAVLIQVEPSYDGVTAGQIGALANGVPVVAGYLSSAGTGLHTGSTEYQGFAIYPNGYAQQLAAYTITDASSYFAAAAVTAGTKAPPLTADAGTFTLAVTPEPVATPALSNSLNLAGTVLTGAATGGSGGQVNISAPDLYITSATSTVGAGEIAVSGSVLQSWNASEYTLGGISSTTPATAPTGGSSTAAGTTIAVAANNVTVDAGVSLTADQIELVAQQSIVVENNAKLSSTSGKSGSTLMVLPTLQTVTLTDPYTIDANGNQVALPAGSATPLPQGAFLAISDLNLPVVSRPGPSGAAGATITLGSGTGASSGILNSGGAVALDAPGAITIADNSISAKGASLTLSSASIALIGTGTSVSSSDTLNIDSNLLATLQQAGAVRIASQGDIDILGSVNLGATAAGLPPTLGSLTLIGAGINNVTGGSSVFGGTALALGGHDLDPAAQPSSGSGGLTFVADTLTVGPGGLLVNGFATTLAQTGGALETLGYGRLAVGGNLTINAVELTSAPDAVDTVGTTNSQGAVNDAIGTASLSATGNLTIGAPTKLSTNTTLPTAVGGDLTVSALGNLDDAGVILVPGGVVTLNAAGSLHLAGTGSISAAGTLVQAVDQSAPAPGGTVTLTAAGNVALDAGATINVSGEGIAPAGTISITSAGTVSLVSTLSGEGNTGGSFTLQAGQLSGGLTPLAANLYSGGFSNAINVRVRTGDLYLAPCAPSPCSVDPVTGNPSGTGAGGKPTVPTAGVLFANHITLTADSGVVDIAGSLSAESAGERGLIDLSGANGVILGSGGQLQANGSGSTGRGGEIDLNSTPCGTACAANLNPQIILNSGSLISAYGAAQMGDLVLRAPALLASDDVAINVQPKTAPGLGADVGRVGQVIVEPIMVYQTTGATVDNDLSNDVGMAANFLLTARSNIAARLTTAGATPINVQAGVELQDANAADSLMLQQSLDLSSYSTQGQVVSVNLRAAGSIAIDGSITDGILGIGGIRPALSPTASGSLTFVAGADLSSANSLSLLSNSQASLTVGGNGTQALVATGTGNLNLSAAGDVIFGTGSSAFVAGTLASSQTRGNGEVLNFGMGGGNVRIVAGADILGSPVSGDNGDYSVTGWQDRQIKNGQAQYGVNLAAFDWNVGAFGGGDLRVSAGGNVEELSAATADSRILGGTVYGAGGGLSITAGGDIGSAQIYVASGKGTLTAAGGLTAPLSSSNGSPVGSSIALGDSQISVWARQSLQIDAVYNPTFAPPDGTGFYTTFSGQFFTYTPSSALLLSSTSGTATFNLNPNGTMQTLLGQQVAVQGDLNLVVMPANLTVQSLQQDIDLNFGAGDAILFPSPTGQLVVFAGRDITVPSAGIAMSDSYSYNYPTAALPLVSVLSSPQVIAGLAEFQGVIHTGDSTPALVTAGGSIDGLSLALPKSADVVAGQDITDLTYQGQNVGANDTTLIAAGRDIVYTGQSGGIQLGGLGTLEVVAGRNLNLGFGDGITTVGNLENDNLPSAAGADLTTLVGYGSSGGADLSGFLQKIVFPSAAYQTQLVSYVESLTGASGLALQPAEADFAGFTTAQQTAFIDDVFFNELLLSGRAANGGTGVGFAQGYAAIDALFPYSRSPTAANPDPYSGSLNLISSGMYTESGGNISILVPGGNIDVGLANPPVGVGQKPAYQLGVVAEGTGNVDIYSFGDVNVNTSRIFTLGGGNILIWSTTGSIDAGNGSKSSLSVPPPLVLVNQSGTITLDYGATLTSGSGIRTIQTDPNAPPGDVDLDAPVGTVNAGDAGIGAAGNINIAAAHVIGVTNINFGGTATGVPSDLSSLGATLSGVSAVANSSTNSAANTVAESNAAKEATPLAQTALSWLDVFVTGLGEDNCKPDDIECLNRQKKASP